MQHKLIYWELNTDHFIHFYKFTISTDTASILSDMFSHWKPLDLETQAFEFPTHNFDFGVPFMCIQLINMIFPLLLYTKG